MAELKKLFEILDINPTLLDNANDRDQGVQELVVNTLKLANHAVTCSVKLDSPDFTLWGEPLASEKGYPSDEKRLR